MTSVLIHDPSVAHIINQTRLQDTFGKNMKKKEKEDSLDYNIMSCDSTSSSTSTTPSPPQSPYLEKMDDDIVNTVWKPNFQNKLFFDQSESFYQSEDIASSKEQINFTKKRKSYDEDYITKVVSPQPLKKRNKVSIESTTEKHNVDITHLLSLPQKEAAFKLGISESMLCKRFKESTRRKWPFRYLRKIEKTIYNLKEMKNIGNISHQDQIKLDDLLAQKKMSLAPVKIRITNHDRLQIVSCSMQTSNESDDEIETFEDEFAVETLGLLRSMSPKLLLK